MVCSAYLVPHATLRLEVLGFRDVPLVSEPLTKAKRLVREGLEQGAVGFTTGSKYYPGPWADTRELIELCSVVREAGKVYMSEPRATTRAFGGGGPTEAMEIMRQSGVKLHLAMPTSLSTSIPIRPGARSRKFPAGRDPGGRPRRDPETAFGCDGASGGRRLAR